MKYLFQFGVILTITFVAELVYNYVPLPIPASIYGLAIMLILLITKVIKLEWVNESGKYLIAVMPIMFIPAGAKLITVADSIIPVILPMIFILFFTTIMVMVVSGKVTQFIIKRDKKNGK